MYNGREKPTEYMQLLQDSFEALTKSENGEKPKEDKDTYFICMDGPEQYGVEVEMLKFLKDNPNTTLSQVVQYFIDISPEEPLEPFDDEE